MTALICGVCMFFQDVFLTFKSLAANRGHLFLAGLFDMLGGFMVVGTIGISTTTAVKHGVSWTTVGVFAAMGVADFSGAAVGTLLGNRWIHNDNLSSITHH